MKRIPKSRPVPLLHLASLTAVLVLCVLLDITVHLCPWAALAALSLLAFILLALAFCRGAAR